MQKCTEILAPENAPAQRLIPKNVLTNSSSNVWGTRRQTQRKKGTMFEKKLEGRILFNVIWEPRQTSSNISTIIFKFNLYEKVMNEYPIY